MLQRDYLLEVISQFVEAIVRAMRLALFSENPVERFEAIGDAEKSVASLLDLDADLALQLAPESLVTMMVLSGIGDSLASYVAYTLNLLGDAYEDMGESDTAAIRREQARAVGESFGCDPTEAPPELADFDAEVTAAKG